MSEFCCGLPIKFDQRQKRQKLHAFLHSAWCSSRMFQARWKAFWRFMCMHVCAWPSCLNPLAKFWACSHSKFWIHFWTTSLDSNMTISPPQLWPKTNIVNTSWMHSFTAKKRWHEVNLAKRNAQHKNSPTTCDTRKCFSCICIENTIYTSFHQNSRFKGPRYHQEKKTPPVLMLKDNWLLWKRKLAMWAQEGRSVRLETLYIHTL